MAILNARLRKNNRTSAPMELLVLVDEIPHPHDMRYYIQKRGDRTLFCSQPNNGLVLYGIHNPNDQQGSEGRISKIIDIDGKWHEFRGPWSSSAGLMNKYFPASPDIVEVLVTNNRKHFERGYVSTAYSMQVSILNEWLRTNDFGWVYEIVDNDYAPDEPTYQLVQTIS